MNADKNLDFKALGPGRELDAKVAELVMGQKPKAHALRRQVVGHGEAVDTCVVCGASDYAGEVTGACVPDYSTDIAAAWTIVDLHSKTFGTMKLQVGNSDAVCSFSRGGFDWPAVIGDSAPHAICLAALKALETK